MADAAAHANVAHHFDDAEQQYNASTLGMWVFLVNEVMFFGGLLTVYVYYRAQFPDGFAHASNHLDVRLGTINTAVLIGSSLTMALAVHASQVGHAKALARWVWLTLALGSVFLGIKGYEYLHKFHEHLIPGPHFVYPEPFKDHAEIFFSLYFALTGLHALHMVIGVPIMLWIIRGARRMRFDAAYHTPVEIAGLYWHFVDIVWIFLFPLLYLIGRHTH